MKGRLATAAYLLLGTVITAGALTLAVDTTPSAAPSAQLELRASTAFNRGEYATALPILQKMADSAKDDPAKLGPIQEKIRVCEKAMASLKASAPAAAPSPTPADTTSAEARKPHPPYKSGDTLEMAIKDLGNFDYNQEHGGNIPKDVLGLNGAKIRLRGFMIPMDQAENITQFALVPSLFACCFGQPPQIQHTIVVDCPKGKAVGYCPDEIIVEGTLKVQEKKDDGYVVSIFGIDVSSVKPAPK